MTLETIGTSHLTQKDIETRLFHVYDFAQERIAALLGSSVLRHLDVGTYNGFAQYKLARIAQKVYSFDIERKKLRSAQERPDVQTLIQQKQVMLYEMDAKHIAFADNTFDSATIIEVFGAGFDGKPEDVKAVFEGVHRVLRPGGVLVFTVRSRTMEMFLKTFETFDTKGIALPRRTLNPILRPLFNSVSWYGQLTLPRATVDGVNGVFFPNEWKPDYTPHILDETTHVPIFWTGVCQKPLLSYS